MGALIVGRSPAIESWSGCKLGIASLSNATCPLSAKQKGEKHTNRMPHSTESQPEHFHTSSRWQLSSRSSQKPHSTTTKRQQQTQTNTDTKATVLSSLASQNLLHRSR